MPGSNIGSLDLNLLKVFQALVTEGSVTRAAERLGIGQPAVSQALGRLRESVGDELFVRAGDGMRPTPRAERLVGPVSDALRQIEAAVYGDAAFDAATTDRCFTLGVTDYVAAALVPRLLRSLSAAMPAASLQLRHADRSSATAMLSDLAIDVAVGFFPDVPKWLRQQKLFLEQHVCVFDPVQIPASVPIGLDDYIRHHHVLVSPSSGRQGFVDDLLLLRGRTRRVVLTTPYFLLVGHLLKDRPLIATLPGRYAQECATLANLAVSPLPFEAPVFDISMVWAASESNSPAQMALRGLIAQTATA